MKCHFCGKKLTPYFPGKEPHWPRHCFPPPRAVKKTSKSAKKRTSPRRSRVVSVSPMRVRSRTTHAKKLAAHGVDVKHPCPQCGGPSFATGSSRTCLDCYHEFKGAPRKSKAKKRAKKGTRR